jgi:transposase
MRSKVERQSEEAEKAVRDIRRATRRQYSAEDKVRIVIAGLRGEDSIAELCRKEGINQNLYYRWSKVAEVGKRSVLLGRFLCQCRVLRGDPTEPEFVAQLKYALVLDIHPTSAVISSS